jgi:hypothetical protein
MYFHSAKLHFCDEKNKQMRSFAMKKGATRAVAPFLLLFCLSLYKAAFKPN